MLVLPSRPQPVSSHVATPRSNIYIRARSKWVSRDSRHTLSLPANDIWADEQVFIESRQNAVFTIDDIQLATYFCREEKDRIEAMTSSQQVPRDFGKMMCFLQTLKDQTGDRTESHGDLASKNILQTTAVLPSKEYGTTNLSDQAQAVLGDVYHFYGRDQAEQRLILQEFREQMESFCQRQVIRDENFQRALCLITEINHGLCGKGSTSESSRNALSGQQLLSIISKLSKRERSAEQTLELCQSIAQRRQSQLTFVKPSAYMSAINQWLTASGSMLLHLTSTSPAEDHMTDIVVQLTAILRDSGNPTMWSLPVDSEQSDIQNILYDILPQLLEFQPNFTMRTNPAINLAMLEEPLGIDVWIDLLCAALASTPKAFIILNLPRSSPRTHQDIRSRVINALAALVDSTDTGSNVLKVLVHTSNTTATCMQSMKASEKSMDCAIDAIPTNINLAKRSSARARSLTRQSLLVPVLFDY